MKDWSTWIEYSTRNRTPIDLWENQDVKNSRWIDRLSIYRPLSPHHYTRLSKPREVTRLQTKWLRQQRVRRGPPPSRGALVFDAFTGPVFDAHRDSTTTYTECTWRRKPRWGCKSIEREGHTPPRAWRLGGYYLSTSEEHSTNTFHSTAHRLLMDERRPARSQRHSKFPESTATGPRVGHQGGGEA